MDYLCYSLKMKQIEVLFQMINVPKIEIKDFNVLIDGKQFFETPVKNKEEGYEKIIKMSKNNDYNRQFIKL